MSSLNWLHVCLLFIVAATFASADKLTAATVYWDPDHKLVKLKEGVMEVEGDAYGFLNDTLSSTGWSVLEIRAGYGETPETDEITFFLAGYLEGFLTARQMMDHYTNMYPQLITDPKMLDPVQKFMDLGDDDGSGGLRRVLWALVRMGLGPLALVDSTERGCLLGLGPLWRSWLLAEPTDMSLQPPLASAPGSPSCPGGRGYGSPHPLADR